MGIGDKFKDLAKQAQDAVAEHRDQIHDAVDAASVAANQKTKGKYTDKIAKFSQKAANAVDKVGSDEGSPEPAAAAPVEPNPPPSGSQSGSTPASPGFDD